MMGCLRVVERVDQWGIGGPKGAGLGALGSNVGAHSIRERERVWP